MFCWVVWLGDVTPVSTVAINKTSESGRLHGGTDHESYSTTSNSSTQICRSFSFIIITYFSPHYHILSPFLSPFCIFSNVSYFKTPTFLLFKFCTSKTYCLCNYISVSEPVSCDALSPVWNNIIGCRQLDCVFPLVNRKSSKGILASPVLPSKQLIITDAVFTV